MAKLEFKPEVTKLTLTLKKRQGDEFRALDAMTFQAKNIRNTTLYLIRQIFTAYRYDKDAGCNVLKDTIRPEQQVVVDHYNQTITDINQARTEKHPAKVEKAITAGKQEDELPALKLVPALSASMSNLAASLLDMTIMDNATRDWKDRNGNSVYKRVPGVMAQQVVLSVKDDFTGFFKASQQYALNPEPFSGKPQMPNYKGKNEHSVLEIPLRDVHGALPKIKCKNVPSNYEETEFLPKEVLAAFSGFDVEALIDKVCKNRGLQNYTPKHLRIVPTRKSIKIEVVIDVVNTLPEQSFLARLYRDHATTLSEIKTEKERAAWIERYVKAQDVNTLRIMGGDLGVKNIISVAYSTGHKAAVFAGNEFSKKVGGFNDRIDALIAKNSTDRAKALQGKKNALLKEGKRLEAAENLELNQLLSVVYAMPEFRRLNQNKQQWLDNYIHQLSHTIVEQCAQKAIEVIVLGRNKGWKQEMAMGKNNNRKFGQVAHAKLIEQIKYKANLKGMVVITTEESYTSKTSFVNGDKLNVYTENKETAENPASTSPALTGNRSNDRNWFINKNRTDRWKKVHADVNGAFNIIRKVFSAFGFNTNITLKFTLYRLSPTQGMTPFLL